MNAEPTFSNCFRPGHNRFGMLRHVLALMVLADHAYVLTGQHGALSATGWQTSLGSLAVACFFLLSGALVTASWLQRPRLKHFLVARALRLLPGYFACLLITVGLIAPLAWLLEHGNLHNYLTTSPGPVGYLLRNGMLVQWQPSIAGLFSNHFEAEAVNGSLWSIPWESGCYGMVALLGVTGVLVRRKLVLPLLALVALVNVLVFPEGSLFGVLYLTERITLLPMYFFCGAGFYLYREHIPRLIMAGWLALAGVVIGGCFHWPLTAFLCLPYAFFYFSTNVAVEASPSHHSQPDLSYGIYIYGFPVQQLWIAYGVGSDSSPMSALALLSASLVIVLALSWLSWTVVEAPALRLKTEKLRT